MEIFCHVDLLSVVFLRLCYLPGATWNDMLRSIVNTTSLQVVKSFFKTCILSRAAFKKKPPLLQDLIRGLPPVLLPQTKYLALLPAAFETNIHVQLSTNSMDVSRVEWSDDAILHLDADDLTYEKVRTLEKRYLCRFNRENRSLRLRGSRHMQMWDNGSRDFIPAWKIDSIVGRKAITIIKMRISRPSTENVEMKIVNMLVF